MNTDNTNLALIALKIAALVIFLLSVDKFVRTHSEPVEVSHEN